MSEYHHPTTVWAHFAIAMAKPHSDFYFDPTYWRPDSKFVQLGPGHKLIEPGIESNWVNLDYPEWDADHDALPFDDESIDGVCTYHSMDHFADPISVLADVQRILKKGGWFVNIVPHYSSELWHTDLTHKSQFGIDTWRNIFSTRHYDHAAMKVNVEWKFQIVFNMIMGLTERNLVLVTQLIREP